LAAASRPLAIVLVVILLALAAAGVVVWPYLEGAPPQVTLTPEPTHLGVSTELKLAAADPGRGLGRLVVAVEQEGQRRVVLDQKVGPDSWEAGGPAELEQSLQIQPKQLGLAQGPATLVVEATDRSLRHWGHGNTTRQEQAVVVDTQPPRLGVLSRRIYLNRGGSALVLYKVSPDTASHGVRVGEQVFAGHRPWADHPDAAACYFAYADDLPRDAAIAAFAQDAAGNHSSAPLTVKLRWKRFRHDKIVLSDQVLGALAARFAARAPAGVQGDLAVFQWINADLREENHHAIQKVLAGGGAEQHWRQDFLRPQGKPMSGFGDRRTYFYQDREVSQAVHRGVDLADVANSPIPAAAAGRVLHAGALGIYGQTVVLDHGLGLATLYGHLSALEVEPGQMVERGQRLGLSGATGLALGDHLHFSVLVGGVFVNPAEWWDPHWIADNVELRFSEAGLPRP
jgi:murein DD-endopeptidase MepM/ murein hydrolase activator NlpD